MAVHRAAILLPMAVLGVHLLTAAHRAEVLRQTDGHLHVVRLPKGAHQVAAHHQMAVEAKEDLPQ